MQEGFERFEHRDLALGGELSLQPLPDPAYQRDHPRLVVARDFVRSAAGDQRRLGRHKVIFHGNDLLATASFQGLRAIVLVGQIVLERAKQKRAQSPLLTVGAAEGVVGEQVREEALHQVLRVGGRVTVSAHEGVQRRPVRLAELAQRLLGGGRRLAFQSLAHHAPVRRVEGRAAFLQGAWVVLHEQCFYSKKL